MLLEDGYILFIITVDLFRILLKYENHTNFVQIGEKGKEEKKVREI